MSDRNELLAKIEAYKAALVQDPKSKQFLALAAAYLQLDQVDDALEVALRGTWELPQFAEGYVAVGQVYVRRDVTGKAEQAFFRALSVDQMCLSAYKELARLYHAAGDNQKASDVLTKAIMLDPGDQSLQQLMTSFSSPATTVGAGETTGAETVVSNQQVHQGGQAMDRSGEGMKPITTATIADIYVEQGLYDKALEVYRELLTEKPNDPAVHQKIAELQALVSGGEPAAPQAPIEPAAPTAPVMPHPVAAAGSNDTVIDQLNGWLENIQARRNRV